jgi:WS/DGAT/MGAT family acyltransferase
MRMFQASLSEDPNARGMPPVWAVPRSPRTPSASFEDAQVALDSIGDQLKYQFHLLSGAARGIKLYLEGLIEGDPHGMRGPFQAPATMINERVSASRRFVAQSYSLSRIRAVGKALDATINDIVLAMSAGALRSYLIDQGALPNEPLTAMAPVNIRPADGPEMGNAISAIIVSLATDIEDPAGRLRAIQKSTGEGKAVVRSMTRAQIPIYTQLISMPTFLTLLLNIAGHVRPAFNVTVSNVPGPRERLYWNGARLEGMYPVSIVTDGMAINITVTSYVDSLDFGIVACRKSVPGAQRLIDHLETALVELEDAAGLKGAELPQTRA